MGTGVIPYDASSFSGMHLDQPWMLKILVRRVTCHYGNSLLKCRPMQQILEPDRARFVMPMLPFGNRALHKISLFCLWLMIPWPRAHTKSF